MADDNSNGNGESDDHQEDAHEVIPGTEAQGQTEESPLEGIVIPRSPMGDIARGIQATLDSETSRQTLGYAIDQISHFTHLFQSELKDEKKAHQETTDKLIQASDHSNKTRTAQNTLLALLGALLVVAAGWGVGVSEEGSTMNLFMFIGFLGAIALSVPAWHALKVLYK